MNVIPSFTTEFAKYNFKLLMPEKDEEGIVYHGIIKTKRFDDVEIDFLFYNDTFTDFPAAMIGINSQYKFRPYHFPHLSNIYSLCYHDNSIVFDRYDPEKMVRFCFDSVENVLNNSKEDDMSEIKREFPSYWSQEAKNYYSFLSSIDTTAIIQENWIWSPNIPFLKPDESSSTVPIFHIPETPSIAGIEWPIEKYNDLKSWINKISTEREKEIKKFVTNMISKKYYKFTLILFLQDIEIFIGLTIEYKSPMFNIKNKHFRAETIESIFSGNHIIKRFNIDNYSDKKIINSNLSANNITLIDKKILLIGAGTLGSNLSNLLVKNGAGIGDNGLLTIADADIYEPYNYSRHYLGIRWAGSKKADLLKMILRFDFPFLKIDTIPNYVYNIDFDNYDIIIDSTGEESFTQWLNEKYFKSNSNTLVISTWIRGQGQLAECFVFPNNKEACHECLRKSEYYSSIGPNELILRDSCNSIYTPFPITTSMYTCLLIINVINKWLENNLTRSTFFTQSLMPVGEIKDFKISKNEECPVCGKN